MLSLDSYLACALVAQKAFSSKSLIICLKPRAVLPAELLASCVFPLCRSSVCFSKTPCWT